MQRYYDVAVIGGGPIGGYVAGEIALNGFEVAIFEQNKQIGEPLKCAGLATSRVFDFLDISKIDAGKMQLKLTEFSLRSVVSEVVEALSPFAAEKNIDLESFVPDSEPVVNADYNRIVQVLTNLISSAIKSAPSNGYISVRVKDIGNQVTVQVQDDGPSIGSGEIDKIFNLFVQIKRQFHSDKEDLALGLPIAKQLAEMHGGCIWAENGKEQGNSFCFTLPKSGTREKTASAGVKARENLCLRS